MDIEKLIDRLGENTDCWTDKVHGYADLRLDAATALSALQAENEKLRAELNDIKAKWDKYQPREHWETLNELCKNLHDELEQVKRENDALWIYIEIVDREYQRYMDRGYIDRLDELKRTWRRGQKED